MVNIARTVTRNIFTICVVTVLLISVANKAHAICADPVGDAGEQFFNTSYNIMQYCDGTNWVAMGYTGTADDVGVWTKSGSNLYYNDGNVGIGTNAPAEKLEVTGNIYLNPGSYGGKLIFGSDDGNDIWLIDDFNNSLRFFTRPNLATSGTLRMILSAAGSLGVGGVTNPAARLDVRGDARIQGDNEFAFIKMAATSTSTKDMGIYYGDAQNELRLARYDKAGAWEATVLRVDMDAPQDSLAISSAGNVGIGTNAPNFLLDVDGKIGANYLTVSPGDGVNEGGEIKLQGAGAFSDFNFDNYQGNARIHTFQDGKILQLINGAIQTTSTTAYNYFANNVGIGTHTPSSRLHINGTSGSNNDGLLITRSDETASIEMFSATDGYGYVRIEGGDGSNNSENLYLRGSSSRYSSFPGKLGVGIEVPGYTLDVNGSIASSGTAYLNKIYSTGNNVATSTSPDKADIVIGSATGTRHNSSIMFWSDTSASRIYNEADRFYFSVWNQDPKAGANVTLAANPTVDSYILGDLGIGITSPASKLHVVSSDTSKLILQEETVEDTDANYRNYMQGRDASGDVTWALGDTSTLARVVLAAHGASNDYPLDFHVGSDTRLRIAPSGNIGIGTPAGTDPVEKLEIRGNIFMNNSESSAIYHSAHNQYFSGREGSYNHAIYTFRPGWGSSGTTYAYMDIQSADTAGNYTTGVRLHAYSSSYFNGGNVGIGNTSPTAKLDITHTGTIGGSSANIDDAGIRVRHTDGYGISIDGNEVVAFGADLNLQASGKINLKTGDVASAPLVAGMTITAGKVGIGISTPEAALDVNGGGIVVRSRQIYAHPTNTTDAGNYIGFYESPYHHAAAGIKVGGILVSDSYSYGTPDNNSIIIKGTAYKPGGGSWTAYSDKRLKTNVNSMNAKTALDKVSKLRGVTFEWKNQKTHDSEKGIQYGFIAQEVEKIFPEWVEKQDPLTGDKALLNGDKAYTVNLPTGFDAHMVEAIKELATKHETKDAQIKSLQTENDALKARLDAVEAKLDALAK